MSADTARAAGAPVEKPAPAAPISEDDFEHKVAHIARLYGWKIAHWGVGWTRKGYRTPARFDGSGFPDWILIQPMRGLIWFRELKAGVKPNRPLDPAQAQWRQWLISAGANYDVWRPADFDDIAAALSNGQARAS